jgi:hypothetical protein
MQAGLWSCIEVIGWIKTWCSETVDCRRVYVLLVAAGEVTTNKRCADSDCHGHGIDCVRWCCFLEGNSDCEKQQMMDLI